MALAGSKRKRNPVSYREPSSDEDSDTASDASFVQPEEGAHEPRQRRAPTRSTKGTAVAATVSQQFSARRHQRSRNSRQTQAVSYKEPDSETDSDEDDEDDETPLELQRRTARQQLTRASLNNKPKRAVVPARRSNRSRKGYRDRKKIKSKSFLDLPALLPSDDNIPDWASLPYHILLQIFIYASHPLYDENFVAMPSISWLQKISLMCKSFSEPGITALYRCLPIMALDKLKRTKLWNLLAEKPDGHAFNYNVKVKRLELGIVNQDTQIVSGIAGLLRHLPQLSELDIYDPLDRPPYSNLRPRSRWHYPIDIVPALVETKIHLKSWSWNAALCTIHQDDFWLKEVHEVSPFRGISALHLTNFHSQGKDRADAPRKSNEEVLASALAALENLKSLHMDTCGIVSKDFLPLLRKDLVVLRIINCPGIDAEALGAFLVTHGGSLKELVLDHNQALDISFLPNLKATCPRLEVLHMDLNYFGSAATLWDSKPKYENLLVSNEVPSWPSTLREIEMVYLRKWTAETAETFFESLVDSAEDLPDLRVLIVKAILGIAWRDRATIRDRWIPKLEKVFLRKMQPPAPHLVSMRTFREWKQSMNSETRPFNNEGATDDGNDEILEPQVQNSEDELSQRQQASQNSTPPNNSVSWGGRRLRPRRRGSLTPQSDESASEEARRSYGSENTGSTISIQGMCSVVDIRIDNMRPSEEQFNENDFLDSEVSGDEDWNSDDDIPGGDDGGYAW